MLYTDDEKLFLKITILLLDVNYYAYLAYTPFGEITLAGPPVIPTGGTIIFMTSPFIFTLTFCA